MRARSGWSLMTSSRQLLRRSISCLFHPVEEEKLTLMLCATHPCMHRTARLPKGPRDLGLPKDQDTQRELVPRSQRGDLQWRCSHRSIQIRSRTSQWAARRHVISSALVTGAGSCTTPKARCVPIGGLMRVQSPSWWTKGAFHFRSSQPSQIGLPGGLPQRLLGSRSLPQSV